MNRRRESERARVVDYADVPLGGNQYVPEIAIRVVHQLGEHPQRLHLAVPAVRVGWLNLLFQPLGFVHERIDPPAQRARRSVHFPFDGDRHHLADTKEFGDHERGEVVAPRIDEVVLAPAAAEFLHRLLFVDTLERSIVRETAVRQRQAQRTRDPLAGRARAHD
jgi:hypothetical protein